MLAFWLAGTAIFCFLVAALGALGQSAVAGAIGWLGLAFLAGAILAARGQRTN